MAEKRGGWETISSEVVHKNPYYSVRQDKVTKPDDSQGFYNVVEAKGSVFIVALDNEQNVCLVGLHRYTNDNFSIEVPAGGVDNDDPLTAAKRELEEETGLNAGVWKELGVIYPANGILSQKNYIFLATGIKPAKSNRQKEEGITEIRTIPLEQAMTMIRDGEITDAESIAALAMAALELSFLKS